MFKRTILALSVAALTVTGVAQAQENATLTLRSGDKVSGQLEDLGGVGFTMRVNGAERQIPTNDVAVIDFTGNNMTDADWAKVTDGTQTVILRNGDTVTGSLYDIGVPGYKANLSDVLAAIALVQLDKVGKHAEIRARQFALYDEGVAGLEGITPLARDARDVHAMHLYVVRIDAERAGATRDEFQRALDEELISTSIHFLPVHRLTWYRERFPEQPPLPIAERGGSEVLSLPLSPAHSDDDIRDAIDAVQRVHARFAA